MLLDRLFRPRAALTAGRSLYTLAVDQARAPSLYADLGAPDTAEGRFEIYSLHVVLLLDRLRGQGDEATDVSQVLFDAYVKDLDTALREMGVGDLSVGKKMRKLGEAFYGRVKSYEAAFAADDRPAALGAVIARTVFADAPHGESAALAAYAERSDGQLARQPLDEVLGRAPRWPDVVR